MEIPYSKKILFSAWACTNQSWFSYQSWNSVINKLFKEVLVFDPQKETYSLGREGMNEAFIELVRVEKPDYIFFWFMYPPEFNLETLEKIKEVSPNTKILNFFGDDDILFDVYTKYMAFFVDYPLASHMEHFWKYKANSIPNVFSTFGVNTDNFKPLNLAKKYDVTFIGTPIEDRPEMIKHLVNNGIKVKIFGGGWYKYPELSEYYGGKVSTEEMVKIINESKINLNFSKTIGGKTGFKAKVFEICACNSFILSEYFTGYFNYLSEGKEIVTFKDKEELLEKVKFYIDNEGERERTAKAAYEKVSEKYSIESEFLKIFNEISKIKGSPKEKKINIKKKEVSLNYKLSNFKKADILEKVKNADYISFESNKAIPSKFKSYFQMISLEKSQNKMSCCDYTVYSKGLGDYLSCYAYKTFNSNKKRFYDLLDLTQLMVKKDFFVNNLDKFIDFEKFKEELFSTEVSFIAIPLLKRINISSIKKEDIGSIFEPLFENELRALSKQKRLGSSKYIYSLIFSSLINKKYILSYLINKLKLKSRSSN